MKYNIIFKVNIKCCVELQLYLGDMWFRVYELYIYFSYVYNNLKNIVEML